MKRNVSKKKKKTNFEYFFLIFWDDKILNSPDFYCSLPNCTVNSIDLELYAPKSRLFANLFCQNQKPGLRVPILLFKGNIVTN